MKPADVGMSEMSMMNKGPLFVNGLVLHSDIGMQKINDIVLVACPNGRKAFLRLQQCAHTLQTAFPWSTATASVTCRSTKSACIALVQEVYFNFDYLTSLPYRQPIVRLRWLDRRARLAFAVGIGEEENAWLNMNEVEASVVCYAKGQNNYETPRAFSLTSCCQYTHGYRRQGNHCVQFNYPKCHWYVRVKETQLITIISIGFPKSSCHEH